MGALDDMRGGGGRGREGEYVGLREREAGRPGSSGNPRWRVNALVLH